MFAWASNGAGLCIASRRASPRPRRTLCSHSSPHRSQSHQHHPREQIRMRAHPAMQAEASETSLEAALRPPSTTTALQPDTLRTGFPCPLRAASNDRPGTGVRPLPGTSSASPVTATAVTGLDGKLSAVGVFSSYPKLVDEGNERGGRSAGIEALDRGSAVSEPNRLVRASALVGPR